MLIFKNKHRTYISNALTQHYSMACSICLGVTTAASKMSVDMPCGHRLHTLCFSALLDNHLTEINFASKPVQCCMCRATVLPSWIECKNDASILEAMEREANTQLTPMFAISGLLYYAGCGRKTAAIVQRAVLITAAARRFDTLRGSASKITLVKRMKRLKECRVRMASKRGPSITARMKVVCYN